MEYQTILTKFENKVLRVSLNRVEVKNAFNEMMIAELTSVFQNLPKETKLIVLEAEGDTFCSGGDLNWMKASMQFSREENYLDAEKLSSMFLLINECSVPVIGVVQRYALGGGVGLVSVCDYVIAEKSTKFSLSEVKLGLVPACIGPFVLAKIGESWCRALFLSANRFSAEHALKIGLVHEIAEGELALQQQAEEIIKQILASSPQALKVAKAFLRQMKGKNVIEQNSLAGKTLADIRVTSEAQEGFKAFLEKRAPQW